MDWLIDSVTVAWLVTCFGAQGNIASVFDVRVLANRLNIYLDECWLLASLPSSWKYIPSTCCSWCGSFFRCKCRCPLTQKGKFRCIWLPTACAILLELANSWFRLCSQNVFNARARNRSELFPDFFCKLVGAPFASYRVLDSPGRGVGAGTATGPPRPGLNP